MREMMLDVIELRLALHFRKIHLRAIPAPPPAHLDFSHARAPWIRLGRFLTKKASLPPRLARLS